MLGIRQSLAKIILIFSLIFSVSAQAVPSEDMSTLHTQQDQHNATLSNITTQNEEKLGLKFNL